jgi:hypothetical protein
MALQIKEFPACCVMSIAINFGGTDTSAWQVAKSEDKIRSFLEREIEYEIRRGNAALVATTNNNQKIANKVLHELGFAHSKWMSKHHHPETKVRLWWKVLND